MNAFCVHNEGEEPLNSSQQAGIKGTIFKMYCFSQKTASLSEADIRNAIVCLYFPEAFSHLGILLFLCRMSLARFIFWYSGVLSKQAVYWCDGKGSMQCLLDLFYLLVLCLRMCVFVCVTFCGMDILMQKNKRWNYCILLIYCVMVLSVLTAESLVSSFCFFLLSFQVLLNP